MPVEFNVYALGIDNGIAMQFRILGSVLGPLWLLNPTTGGH